EVQAHSQDRRAGHAGAGRARPRRPRRRRPRGRGGVGQAPQRLLRPDPRAVRGGEPPLRRAAPGGARRRGQHRAVARRVQQAGPRDHRRAQGRRRDPRAGVRRRATREGRPDRQGVGEGVPKQLQPVHLDDRVPRPQGQPEGDQGLGRPGEAGRAGRRGQPEDERGRPLGVPERLGVRRQGQVVRPVDARGRPGVERRRRRGQEVPRLRRRGGRGVRGEVLPQRAGAGHGRPRVDGHVRAEGHRRRAGELGERRVPRDRGVRQGPVRDRVPVGQHPGRAARRDRRQERRRQGHAQARRGVPQLPVHPRGAGGDRRPALPPARPGRPRPVQGLAAADQAVHDRGDVRRLGPRAQGFLRRRRHVRPTLQAAGGGRREV
ncbi:MAG: Sulfate and thiosulfate binding protein CysP, partial [uncultured Phycisphaerae bacterium]